MRALSSLINVNTPNLVLFVGEALVGNDAVDQLVKFNRHVARLWLCLLQHVNHSPLYCCACGLQCTAVSFHSSVARKRKENAHYQRKTKQAEETAPYEN
jgi:hypothetical protein